MKGLVHYAPMVGVPLLGVALALRVGGHLTAPPSVAGQWRVVESRDAGPSCAGLTAIGAIRELRIAQSGPGLRVLLRGEHGTALLTGKLANWPDSAAERAGEPIPVAAASETLSLQGEVRRDSLPARFRLDLTEPSCGATPALQIIAQRPVPAGAASLSGQR